MKDNDLNKSLGDLFKSEVGDDGDKPIIDCPHCDEPITKSDVIAKAKASGLPVKGLPGNKKSDKAREQNNASGEGSNARGSGGPKVATHKSGKKVPKTDPAYPGQYAAKKSVGDDDASEETEDMTEDTTEKSLGRPSVRGSDFVQYIDQGNAVGGDAYIAKAIAEGTLGQMPTTPIDKNHRNR